MLADVPMRSSLPRIQSRSGSLYTATLGTGISYPNPWSRVFLQKLIVAQLVKEFLAF